MCCRSWNDVAIPLAGIVPLEYIVSAIRGVQDYRRLPTFLYNMACSAVSPLSGRPILCTSRIASRVPASRLSEHGVRGSHAGGPIGGPLESHQPAARLLGAAGPL